MKIVCFHVLNDYSGSPKVLEMVLSGLLSKGYSINLVTSKGNGALNNLQGKKNMIFYQYYYRFSQKYVVECFTVFVCAMLYFFLFFSLSVSKRYCVLSEYHHAGGGCCCR